MKFAVISDVHGRGAFVERVMEMHRDRDGLLFLGDGIRDIPLDRIRENGKLFGGVRGNCDMALFGTDGFDFPNELLLRLGEYNVIMMHGHTHSVKSGETRAIEYASKRGADILLYGHTHIPTETYYPEGYDANGYVLPKPLWVMNPGSLFDGSFGLLQIRRGQILISHGNIK